MTVFSALGLSNHHPLRVTSPSLTLNDSNVSIKYGDKFISGYLSQSKEKLEGLLFKSEYSPLTPQLTVPAAKYAYLPRK